MIYCFCLPSNSCLKHIIEFNGVLLLWSYMRSIEKEFYKTARWVKCRDAYFKRVGGLCERCLAKGLYEPAKIIHHKEHLNRGNVNNPAIAYGFDNLEALCQDCHNKEHFGEKQEQRYFFLDGKLIIKN